MSNSTTQQTISTVDDFNAAHRLDFQKSMGSAPFERQMAQCPNMKTTASANCNRPKVFQGEIGAAVSQLFPPSAQVNGNHMRASNQADASNHKQMLNAALQTVSNQPMDQTEFCGDYCTAPAMAGGADPMGSYNTYEIASHVSRKGVFQHGAGTVKMSHFGKPL